MFFLLALCSLFLVACTETSSSHNESTPVEESSPRGLIRVLSAGHDVYLGTDDESASSKDRPRMLASFTYDFWLSEHEVTCGEFDSLMKVSGACSSDFLPQVSVTYYDAVLYANAKSKSEKLDTAYTYSSATFDSTGNCVLLENLVFDPSKDSYRLPTEAEWVYAAHGDWNVEDGWYASNSEYRTHSVCSKGKNALGLCDMAGNVMEWVNDWLGSFRNESVTNYCGASDGGTLGERIIKGGSFRSEANSVNYVSRGDYYTITAVNKSDYVGFRLAFGRIPDATWLDFSGVAQNSRMQVVFSSAEMRKLVNTSRVKLVFRNDVTGKLAFVDYANWGSSVFEIQDTIDAYHPEISPDGIWVAYCTKPEGLDGKSSIYVRLVSMVSETYKLDVESAAIPRWIVKDGDTLISYVTSAGNNADEASWKKEATWAVPFMDGKFGTPRKIFDGTFNGGVTSDYSMAVSGARLLRTRKNSGSSIKDSVWYEGEQACNASLSKDGTKRVLFLDFAGKTGQKFVGQKYGVHERMLFMDSSGSLSMSIKAPEKKSFDHSEWVNSDFAIATLANVNGAHSEISLVDLKDSSVHVLVTGEELWHPNMWMGKVFMLDSSLSSLDSDSAGIYYIPGGSKESIIARQKMEIFWNNVDSMNTVILGSSRPSAAADPTLFSDDIFAINMTCIPNILYKSKYLFENYVLPHAKKLKYVVISLDIDLWFGSELDPSQTFFEHEALRIPGYVYDRNHKFWEGKYPKGMKEYSTNSLNIESERYEFTYHRGMQMVNPGAAGWEEEPNVDYDSTWLDYRADDYRKNLEDLMEIVTLSEEHGVKVVGVIFPQSPNFKNTGSFGRYGIRRSQADSLIQELADISKIHKNFKLLDENKMGNHDYPDSVVVNRDHLANVGARMITPRIDSVLHSF